MRLINIIEKEINKSNNEILKKLLLDEINNINNCIKKYENILNMYPTLNEDVNKYNCYQKQKQLINELFEARKLISIDSESYIKEINRIKKIIDTEFKDNDELNKVVNNNLNYKLLFKLKNTNKFKSSYSYKKINKNNIENMQNDLTNIFFNIILIFKKFNLDTKELVNNNSIYYIINNFETKINNINAKIELLNYANQNKDESSKIVILNKKNIVEQSNILKKLDENIEFTAKDCSNRRRMFRKQEWIMTRNNLRK